MISAVVKTIGTEGEVRGELAGWAVEVCVCVHVCVHVCVVRMELCPV